MVQIFELQPARRPAPASLEDPPNPRALNITAGADPSEWIFPAIRCVVTRRASILPIEMSMVLVRPPRVALARADFTDAPPGVPMFGSVVPLGPLDVAAVSSNELECRQRVTAASVDLADANVGVAGASVGVAAASVDVTGASVDGATAPVELT